MKETYEYINNLFKDRFFDGCHKAHLVKAKTLSAISKQIPQKPVNTRREIVCPTCRTLVGSSPYCRYCGQMLDHSDYPTEKQIEKDCGGYSVSVLQDENDTAGYRKQEWISVEDRLPAEKVNCLVHYKHVYCDDDGYWSIGVSFYDGNKFQIGLAYKVTHWMPLPAPPKMKGGAE